MSADFAGDAGGGGGWHGNPGKGIGPMMDWEAEINARRTGFSKEAAMHPQARNL